jgi:hypothetical protein
MDNIELVMVVNAEVTKPHQFNLKMTIWISRTLHGRVPLKTLEDPNP